MWRDDDVMCRAFLKTRPRLNLRAHGETPIFYAARLQRLKTLKLLIAAGADRPSKTRAGAMPSTLRVPGGCPRIVIERLAELKRRMK